MRGFAGGTKGGTDRTERRRPRRDPGGTLDQQLDQRERRNREDSDWRKGKEGSGWAETDGVATASGAAVGSVRRDG